MSLSECQLIFRLSISLYYHVLTLSTTNSKALCLRAFGRSPLLEEKASFPRKHFIVSFKLVLFTSPEESALKQCVRMFSYIKLCYVNHLFVVLIDS